MTLRRLGSAALVSGLGVLVAFGLLLMGATLGHASVIFADDFNRLVGVTDNTVGNGWVEIESLPTDARIILGVELELNGPFSGSVTQHIGSTLEYPSTNISLIGAGFLRSQETR